MRIMFPQLVCLSLIMPGVAVSADWTMNSADSRLEFIATYAGSDMPGVFRDFSVALTLDLQQPGASRLVVTIDVASADMGDDDMNEAVASVAWFDSAAFMTATFTSDDIAILGPGDFLATGVLDLKGVRCPVSVPFTWRDDGRLGSMRGEFSLQRLDFGIGTGSWTATDEVTADVRVRFDVAFRKAD